VTRAVQGGCTKEFHQTLRYRSDLRKIFRPVIIFRVDGHWVLRRPASTPAHRSLRGFRSN